MLVLCEVLESILRRKIKNVEENIKWLYINVKYLLIWKMIITVLWYVWWDKFLYFHCESSISCHLSQVFVCKCVQTENKQEPLDILTQLQRVTLLGLQRCGAAHYVTGVLQWIDIDCSRKTGWGGRHEPTVKDAVLALLDKRETCLGMWGWMAALSAATVRLRCVKPWEEWFFCTGVGEWVNDFPVD